MQRRSSLKLISLSAASLVAFLAPLSPTIAQTADPAGSTAAGASADTRCYELRVYHAQPGRLEALQNRFRNHTIKLFEKHGLTNLGYWVPQDNPDGKLYYVISAPTRAARDASFKTFGADPEWKAVVKASEADGRLVKKVESTFLTATDYSPKIQASVENPGRVFELRTYTASKGNLAHLHSRFRDHTMKLFSKHGMKHFAYWTYTAGQPGADDTLIYLLSHASKEAAEASFKAFRDDPEWTKVREASEKTAGGSLTIPDGVKSLFLLPTDYSMSK